jgi:hypothetical protein
LRGKYKKGEEKIELNVKKWKEGREKEKMRCARVSSMQNREEYPDPAFALISALRPQGSRSFKFIKNTKQSNLNL